MRISRHEYLIGFTDEGSHQIDPDYGSLAQFISTNGLVADLFITDPTGVFVLDTFGIFINRCPDQTLLEELKEVLAPLQIQAGTAVGLPECQCQDQCF